MIQNGEILELFEERNGIKKRPNKADRTCREDEEETRQQKKPSDQLPG